MTFTQDELQKKKCWKRCFKLDIRYSTYLDIFNIDKFTILSKTINVFAVMLIFLDFLMTNDKTKKLLSKFYNYYKSSPKKFRSIALRKNGARTSVVDTDNFASDPDPVFKFRLRILLESDLVAKKNSFIHWS